MFLLKLETTKIFKLNRTFWRKCFNAQYTQPLYHHRIIHVGDPQAEPSHLQRQMHENAAVSDDQLVYPSPSSVSWILLYCKDNE